MSPPSRGSQSTRGRIQGRVNQASPQQSPLKRDAYIRKLPVGFRTFIDQKKLKRALQNTDKENQEGVTDDMKGLRLKFLRIGGRKFEWKILKEKKKRGDIGRGESILNDAEFVAESRESSINRKMMEEAGDDKIVCELCFPRDGSSGRKKFKSFSSFRNHILHHHEMAAQCLFVCKECNEALPSRDAPHGCESWKVGDEYSMAYLGLCCADCGLLVRIPDSIPTKDKEEEREEWEKIRSLMGRHSAAMMFPLILFTHGETDVNPKVSLSFGGRTRVEDEAMECSHCRATVSSQMAMKIHLIHTCPHSPIAHSSLAELFRLLRSQRRLAISGEAEGDDTDTVSMRQALMVEHDEMPQGVPHALEKYINRCDRAEAMRKEGKEDTRGEAEEGEEELREAAAMEKSKMNCECIRKETGIEVFDGFDEDVDLLDAYMMERSGSSTDEPLIKLFASLDLMEGLNPRPFAIGLVVVPLFSWAEVEGRDVNDLPLLPRGLTSSLHFCSVCRAVVAGKHARSIHLKNCANNDHTKVDLLFHFSPTTAPNTRLRCPKCRDSLCSLRGLLRHLALDHDLFDIKIEPSVNTVDESRKSRTTLINEQMGIRGEVRKRKKRDESGGEKGIPPPSTPQPVPLPSPTPTIGMLDDTEDDTTSPMDAEETPRREGRLSGLKREIGAVEREGRGEGEGPSNSSSSNSPDHGLAALLHPNASSYVPLSSSYFLCRVCMRLLALDEPAFIDHFVGHGRQLVSCDICNFLVDRADIESHRMAHRKGSIQFFCADCSFSHYDDGDLYRHFNYDHGIDIIFFCKSCGLASKEMATIGRHCRGERCSPTMAPTGQFERFGMINEHEMTVDDYNVKFNRGARISMETMKMISRPPCEICTRERTLVMAPDTNIQVFVSCPFDMFPLTIDQFAKHPSKYKFDYVARQPIPQNKKRQFLETRMTRIIYDIVLRSIGEVAVEAPPLPPPPVQEVVADNERSTEVSQSVQWMREGRDPSTGAVLFRLKGPLPEDTKARRTLLLNHSERVFTAITSDLNKEYSNDPQRLHRVTARVSACSKELNEDFSSNDALVNRVFTGDVQMVWRRLKEAAATPPPVAPSAPSLPPPVPSTQPPQVVSSPPRRRSKFLYSSKNVAKGAAPSKETPQAGPSVPPPPPSTPLPPTEQAYQLILQKIGHGLLGDKKENMKALMEYWHQAKIWGRSHPAEFSRLHQAVMLLPFNPSIWKEIVNQLKEGDPEKLALEIDKWDKRSAQVLQQSAPPPPQLHHVVETRPIPPQGPLAQMGGVINRVAPSMAPPQQPVPPVQRLAPTAPSSSSPILRNLLTQQESYPVVPQAPHPLLVAALQQPLPQSLLPFPTAQQQQMFMQQNPMYLPQQQMTSMPMAPSTSHAAPPQQMVHPQMAPRPQPRGCALCHQPSPVGGFTKAGIAQLEMILVGNPATKSLLARVLMHLWKRDFPAHDPLICASHLASPVVVDGHYLRPTLLFQAKVICSVCGIPFSSEYCALSHLVADHNMIFPSEYDLSCPVSTCLSSFTSPSLLASHLSSHPKFSHHCPQHNVVFATLNAHTTHVYINEHNAKNTCFICGSTNLWCMQVDDPRTGGKIDIRHDMIHSFPCTFHCSFCLQQVYPGDNAYEHFSRNHVEGMQKCMICTAEPGGYAMRSHAQEHIIRAVHPVGSGSVQRIRADDLRFYLDMGVTESEK